MTSRNKPQRAGIYARISADQAGDRHGVINQKADCADLADQLGWTLAAVYEDNDISAAGRVKRPAYLALLADISAGRIDGVIAWHNDRLHRSPRELEDYIEVCEAADVPTQTVRAGSFDLSTVSGRMVARMLGNVARGEWEHMVERMTEAKRHRREAGLNGGGARPYGYRRIPPEHVNPATGLPYGKGYLMIDQDEAGHIRDAYRRFLAGESLGSISRAMNAAGATTPGLNATTQPPRQWTPTGVGRLLARATNAGLIEHQPGKSGRKPLGGQIIGRGRWEPVVPEDTWRAARAILADPSRRTTPGPQRAHLLTGVLSCGVCGGSAFVVIKRSYGPQYMCRKGCVVKDEAGTDTLAAAAITGLLAKPESAAALRPAVDVAELNATRNGLRARLDQIGAALGAGDLDMQQAIAATKPLRDRLDAVEAGLADAYGDSVLAGIAGEHDAEDRWIAATLDRRREIAAALIRVILLPTARTGRRLAGAPRAEPAEVLITFTDLVVTRP